MSLVSKISGGQYKFLMIHSVLKNYANGRTLKQYSICFLGFINNIVLMSKSDFNFCFNEGGLPII